ncbi:MAG: site-2 protease family protein [Sorangiineae bacterium]|nr:site-2 protease family protein [Polyangiaceae bacterium]MEB2323297.1 site-2 protease family protein [Sorangiineae bacterium]
MLSADLVRRIVLNLVPMVLSLTVHEFAHAYVADRLGDDTPRRQGRLTLSPMAHYDVFGTLLVPIAAVYFAGFAMIGWARPVEFSPAALSRRFTMRTGAALVALAGPLSNLALAVLSLGALAATLHFRPDWLVAGAPAVALLQSMYIINVGLCIFNLLPLPPLDGSRLLPRSLDDLQQAVAPYSFLLLLAILYSGTLRHVLLEVPMQVVAGGLEALFRIRVFGGLS